MSREFLDHSDRVYSALLAQAGKLCARGDAEAGLRWIDLTASFASWEGAVGRYSDGALENLALGIGQGLDEVPGGTGRDEVPVIPRTCRRVLHVATQVSGLGGHTRLLQRLVENDRDSVHSLLLTRQNGQALPAALEQALRKSGGIATELGRGMGLLQKARRLRGIATESADLVFLHHHAGDPLPVAAFAQPGGPAVVLINHADHVFWLGSTIADVVASIRPSGLALSQTRRQSAFNSLLPVPLASQIATIEKGAARQELGIPAHQTVLLSIGSAYKYEPTATHNFYRTAQAALTRCEDAHLYLIGPSDRQITGHLSIAMRGRVHGVGYIEDPARLSLYQAATDVYLEGFPFGSLTALLEVAHCGIPLVMALAPGSAVLASDDVALTGIIDSARTEADYVDQVARLLADVNKRERLGRQLRDSIIRHHTGTGWTDYLSKLYGMTAGRTHGPQPIAVTGCESTVDDLELSAITEQRWDRRRSLILMLAQRKRAELNRQDLSALLQIATRVERKLFRQRELRGWAGALWRGGAAAI
jgi:hypothetical protein